MIEPGLNELEHEVRAARAKLATNLSILRSPDTAAEFTETLKLEALDAKDALLGKAKASVQSSLESLIEDVKGRAAANPAATLAIAAGLAWRLMRHPPIATAWIGAGLLSLFRTSAPPMNGRSSPDHLAHARARLGEQAGEAAEIAKEQTAVWADATAAKASEAAGKIKERVQELSAQTAAAASNLAQDTKQQTAAMIGEATDVLQQASHSARSAASSAVSRASAAVDQGWRQTQSAVTEAETRDKLFLAAAGIAVVTALGLAWQRRAAERPDAQG